MPVPPPRVRDRWLRLGVLFWIYPLGKAIMVSTLDRIPDVSAGVTSENHVF